MHFKIGIIIARNGKYKIKLWTLYIVHCSKKVQDVKTFLEFELFVLM